jgi:hypothetical protein
MDRKASQDLLVKPASDSSWQDGTLCSESGRLNGAQFEAAMRHQLRQYAGRRISDFLYHGRGGKAEHAQVTGMVFLEFEQDADNGGEGGRARECHIDRWR